MSRTYFQRGSLPNEFDDRYYSNPNSKITSVYKTEAIDDFEKSLKPKLFNSRNQWIKNQVLTFINFV